MPSYPTREQWCRVKTSLTRLLLLCVVCFALGALFTPTVQRVQNRLRRVSRAADAPPLDVWFYDRQRSQFAVLSASDRILMVGDSRIDEGEWDELLGRTDVANRGVSGDTTAGLLARFDETFSRAFDVCVLQIGINDLVQGAAIEQMTRKYDELLQRIRDRKLASVIVLTSVLLTGERSPEQNERVVELNSALKQLAAERGAIWVDLNAVLAPGGHLEEKYTNDGTHLNGEGYLVFAAALRPQIEQVARPP